MPAGFVKHRQRMRARGYRWGDLVEVGVHRLGVGEGQDQTGGDAAPGADGTEQVGRLIAGVA